MMNSDDLRQSLRNSLAQLGLVPDESGHIKRVLRSCGDAELSASAAEYDDQIEFGLLERQGEVVVNVLHCAVRFEGDHMAYLWSCSDTEPASRERPLTSFQAPELQRALAVLREYIS